MVNKCIIQGNLVRDPEMKKTKTDVPVCNFTIAMSETIGKQEDRLYLDCTAWNKQAEVVYDRFKKGDNILVVGKLFTHTWEKDGQKRKNNCLTVSEVHFTQFNNSQENFSGFEPVNYDEGDMPF